MKPPRRASQSCDGSRPRLSLLASEKRDSPQRSVLTAENAEAAEQRHRGRAGEKTMPVGENRQLEKRENQISGIILDAAIAIHSALLPIHEAQLLSYLKLSGKKLGLLINFHVLRLKDGYKRIVNGL
jgi:hypothetical protein